MAEAVRPGASEISPSQTSLWRIGRARRHRKGVHSRANGQGECPVRRAARIRVIAEGHEFRCATKARGERNEVSNSGALNIGAEEGDHFVFGFQGGFYIDQRFRDLRIN